MSRKISIDIAGDYNSAAIKEATAGVETFGRTVNEAATKNIERLAAQRTKLQELAGEYRAVAASSKAGSVEQVAALDLAAKAQARLGTEALTTATKVKSATREMALAETQLGKFSRGAAEASGRFGRLGFGLAIGSGGFLAGAAAAGGVKNSIDAAKELMDAEEQLRVAITNTGAAFDPKQLDAYLAAESKLSLFTKADLTGSLVGLERATGNVAKAETDEALAANISRGAHKDLATVTQTLISLEDGRTRGVQQLGIKLPVVKTAQDALTASGKEFTAQQKAQAAALDQAAAAQKALVLLQEKYHDSASKFGSSDAAAATKLNTAINTLEDGIGTGLLPVVKQIADPFAKWAQTEADSGDAAKKTKEIVGDLTSVLKDARTAVHLVDDMTGGFKQTLGLLIGLKFAPVVAGWTKEMEAFAGASALGAAEGEATGLLGAMGKLKALGPIGLTIALSFVPKSNEKGPINSSGFGKFMGSLPLVGGLFSQANAASDYINGLLGLNGKSGGGGATGGGGLVGAPGAGGGLSGKALQAAIVADAKRRGVDPTAALAVAAAEGGFSGAVGDGGHAFGPFQVNNAGGVATGMSGSFLKGFANTPAGIDFAMKKIADVAAGKSGYDAIRAIITGFERPADGGAGDLKRATAFLMGGGVSSEAGLQNHYSDAEAIAAIIAQGKAKPHKGKAYKIPDALEAKIRDAQQTFADDMTKAHLATLDDLLGQEEKLLKQHGQQAKAQSIANEITKADNEFTKSMAAHLKAEVASIKSTYASLISTAKANIGSAFGQIITDAQSAFAKETQDYIDNTLGPKYFQGTDAHGMRLQTASEKKLADMQAADTQSQLKDALDQAKQQLTTDTTGALLEHVVDIATGATKDIFGPAGTSAQKTLDQKAIDAAQRALDENTVAIDAAKERAQEDYDYAQAVKNYQQARSLSEAAMVRSLNELEANIEAGKASFTDLQGVLAGFGVSITDIPTDQWQTDFANLGTAVQSLAQVMLDEAAALAKVGDSKDAAAVAATAASIAWGTPVAPGQSSVLSGLGGAGGMELLNPYAKRTNGTKVVALDTGADILRDGFAYVHAGERVQSAEVVRNSGGAGGNVFNFSFPHYVGSHAELAAALKSAVGVEAVSTAVLMGNRRGHIRANQIA